MSGISRNKKIYINFIDFLNENNGHRIFWKVSTNKNAYMASLYKIGMTDEDVDIWMDLLPEFDEWVLLFNEQFSDAKYLWTWADLSEDGEINERHFKTAKYKGVVTVTEEEIKNAKIRWELYSDAKKYNL